MFRILLVTALLISLALPKGALCKGKSVKKLPEWTILVYLAADNDLAEYGLEDLNEMETVGSSKEVNIVVQFDGSADYTPEAASSKRYFIEKDDDFEKVTSPVVEDLGEVDMGQRKTFTKFLRWGVSQYPARKYFVVLWNHGDGWYNSLDAQYMDVTTSIDTQAIEDGYSALYADEEKMRLALAHRARRMQKLSAKAPALQPFSLKEKQGFSPFEALDSLIAFDEGDGISALTTTDLRRSLQSVRKLLPEGQQIEMVGFDACFMGMLEVMYELRHEANYCLASQKTEPGAGWAYDRFLLDLVENPAMNGQQLGQSIIKSFTQYYREENEASEGSPEFHSTTTLACVDLRQVEPLVQALDELSQKLIARPDRRHEIWQTVAKTQHSGEIQMDFGCAGEADDWECEDYDYGDEPEIFVDEEPDIIYEVKSRHKNSMFGGYTLAYTAHRDLVHFAQNLCQQFAGDTEITNRATSVIEEAHRAIVAFEKMDGSPLGSHKNANGLAIFLPLITATDQYDELQFGKTAWHDFLKHIAPQGEEEMQKMWDL